MKRFSGKKSKAYQEIIKVMNGEKPDYNDKGAGDYPWERRLTYYLEGTEVEKKKAKKCGFTCEQFAKECFNRHWKYGWRQYQIANGISIFIDDRTDEVVKDSEYW